MSELVLDQGTVMLYSPVITNRSTTIDCFVGYTLGSVGSQVVSEPHLRLTDHHKVFRLGNPLLKLNGGNDPKNTL